MLFWALFYRCHKFDGEKKAFWQLSAYGNGVMQNKAAMLGLRCRMWPDDQTKSTFLSCFPD